MSIIEKSLSICLSVQIGLHTNDLTHIYREATGMIANGPPTLISLGGGQPNPSTFPFKSIQVESRDGNKFILKGKDLSKALQYSETSG